MRWRLVACALFLEIAFVCDIGMSLCVCVCSEAINYIYMILNLYNQLNKFVTLEM